MISNRREDEFAIDVFICHSEVNIACIQREACNFLEWFDDIYIVINLLNGMRAKLSCQTLTLLEP